MRDCLIRKLSCHCLGTSSFGVQGQTRPFPVDFLAKIISDSFNGTLLYQTGENGLTADQAALQVRHH